MAALLLFAAFPVFSAIKWIDKDHDFGVFYETDGPTTGTSRFVNLGPDPVSIFHVRPSCGCTSADYTKQPIAPGDTAVISYTYDPVGRPGKFDKTVKVTLSDGVQQIIKITGTIIGSPETLASRFPLNGGNMYFSDSFLDMGDVVKGRTPIKIFRGYVVVNDSIIPSIKSDSPAIRFKQTPETLEKFGPGDVVSYTVYFDSEKQEGYGPVEIPLTITMPPAGTDGVSSTPTEEATVMLRAVLIPDPYPFIMSQKGKYASIELNTKLLDLGEIGSEPFESWFTVTNSGKNDLELLKVFSKCKAITVGDLPKPIKPGKSATVKIMIDPRQLESGPQRQSIEILTNDPDHVHVSLPVALLVP